VLEKGVVGGMAAVTASIENYPGFDLGVGGLELSSRLARHAARFGTVIKTGFEVQSLARTGQYITLRGQTESITARTALIATGSTYRHLGIAGEEALIGRGVHYCATCDAPLYKGQRILVVGGGDSAIQESLFIAKFASHVTLLIRGEKFKGNATLRRQLLSLPNVSYRNHTEITAIHSDGHKATGVDTINHQTGHTSHLAADGIFVFVGLSANSEPFKNALALDSRGFIITDTNLATSLPGVFAAGDVRSESIWQIANATGEGVRAALSVRDYLKAYPESQPRSS